MKNHINLAIPVFTLFAATGGAIAADVVAGGTPVVEVAAYSGARGVVEVGALAQFASQTDDPFEGGAGGLYASGALSGVSDSIVWGIDGVIEAKSFTDTSLEAPRYVAVAGAHLGFGSETGLLGGFASVGVTPDFDSEPASGYTVGVEGMVALDTFVIFGQLGWADIRVDRDDSGFTGPFARIGAVYAFGEDFAVMADLQYGRADDGFEDSDGDGTYYSVGVRAAYALPMDFDAFLTAGYEYSYYQANTEDEGFAHTVKLGLAIPFGDGSSAASTLNPLATTSHPYRAASWGETLD